MDPMILLLLSSIGFVGSHFLMSHPLRAGLVSRLGATGFLGLYTVVSFLLLGLMIHAYRLVPAIGPPAILSGRSRPPSC